MSIQTVTPEALAGERRSLAREPRPRVAAGEATVSLSGADAVFEHTWAEMRRSRRRWMIGFGLAFAACLVIASFLGQLHFEVLPGLLD